MKRVVPVVVLIAVVVALYAQTRDHAFLTWDDPHYVTDNPHVANGVTAEGLRWAFTSTLHGNWHPLTAISHMLDVELFGLDPAGHHLMNVALHAINAALLFLLLMQLTGAAWRSAIAALLFAVHPLNVETVAWIAERKSLLSLLFGLVAIMAYVRWTRRPSFGVYAGFLGCFALSLMSKSMLVTLPVLLWSAAARPPLWNGAAWPRRAAAVPPHSIDLRAEACPTLPAFAMSLACGIVTIAAQRAAGAMSEIPLGDRLLNALVSLAWYPAKLVWPSSLNALYLHPSLAHRAVPFLAIVASLAFIALLVFVARKSAAMTAGLLWYFVALLPVLGLVQAGYQSRADRYAYVPLIGLFIAIAFAPVTRRALIAVPAAAAILFSIVTWQQTKFWKNEETLYTRAVAIDPENWVMLNNMSAMYLGRDELEPAVEWGRRAIRLNDRHAPALSNTGVALVQRGSHAEGVALLRRAVELDPQNAVAWRYLAAAHVQLGQDRDGLAAAQKALALNADDPWARYWLAFASHELGLTR